jgi:hypothetical protein
LLLFLLFLLFLSFFFFFSSFFFFFFLHFSQNPHQAVATEMILAAIYALLCFFVAQCLSIELVVQLNVTGLRPVSPDAIGVQVADSGGSVITSGVFDGGENFTFEYDGGGLVVGTTYNITVETDPAFIGGTFESDGSTAIPIDEFTVLSQLFTYTGSVPVVQFQGVFVPQVGGEPCEHPSPIPCNQTDLVCVSASCSPHCVPEVNVPVCCPNVDGCTCSARPSRS